MERNQFFKITGLAAWITPAMVQRISMRQMYGKRAGITPLHHAIQSGEQALEINPYLESLRAAVEKKIPLYLKLIEGLKHPLP